MSVIFMSLALVSELPLVGLTGGCSFFPLSSSAHQKSHPRNAARELQGSEIRGKTGSKDTRSKKKTKLRDRLNPTVQNCILVRKRCDFEKLSLHFVLWRPRREKWSQFWTPWGVYLSDRKWAPHAGSSLGRGKDLLIWLDTTETFLRRGGVQVLSCKQKKKDSGFSENLENWLFSNAVHEMLILDSKTGGEFPLNKEN